MERYFMVTYVGSPATGDIIRGNMTFSTTKGYPNMAETTTSIENACEVKIYRTVILNILELNRLDYLDLTRKPKSK